MRAVEGETNSRQQAAGSKRQGAGNELSDGRASLKVKKGFSTDLRVFRLRAKHKQKPSICIEAFHKKYLQQQI